MNILLILITIKRVLTLFFCSFFPVHIHGFLVDYIVIKVKSNLVIQTPKSQNKELAVI